MKLIRATWDHYKNGLPGKDGSVQSATYVDDADYELTHLPEANVIRAVHRVTGVAYRLDQTGVTMKEAPEERAAVVPVAPEASGTARTTKSSRR